VDLILVNGQSVDFQYRLQNGDRVAVYPVFESLDISPIVRLRPEPLRQPAFVADTQLGKLTRLLRLLGFDTLYKNDYEDSEIIGISQKERRIILTRDVQILKNNAVTHGYWVRSPLPEIQIEEVLRRFDLCGQVKPFTRCLVCNGFVERVDKAVVLDQLPLKTHRYYDDFQRCQDCGKVYWEGPHHQRMKVKVDKLIGEKHEAD
jgi:uncharacterized protein with PIN domain